MLRSKSPKEFSPQITPEVLEAINSDDPGCGRTFVFGLCRLRHMAAKLREERGQRHGYDPCCYCPKFVTKNVTKKVDTPKPEPTQEEPETMPTEPKANCITPDCPNTTSAHSKTGRCKPCQARVNAKLAHEARRGTKAAPKTGAAKPICNETAPKVTQENSTFEPAADTIHASSAPAPAQIDGPDIYRQALRHYGDRNQIFKTAEEASELSASIMRYMTPSWDNKNCYAAMIEELADVEIMCQQMRLLFGSRHIDAVKKDKLERLQKRMEAEQI